MTVPTRTQTTEAVLVADIADVLEALEHAGLPPEAREQLEAVVRRSSTEPALAVPVSRAAPILGVQEDSVRRWIETEALASIPGSRSAKIEINSLAQMLVVLRQARALARDPEVLNCALNMLEDKVLLDKAKEALEEYDAGEWIEVEPDKLDEFLEELFKG